MDKFETEQFALIGDVIDELELCFIDGDAFSRSPSLTEWRCATKLAHRLKLLHSELRGYANACRQFSVVSIRERLHVEQGGEKVQGNGVSKVFKFTKKEIETMPIQYKNLFFTENVVAHVRVKKNLYHEIRAQINGKRITASSKDLAKAKRKFIEKLHALDRAESLANVAQANNTPTFYEYALQWLDTIKRPSVKLATITDYECTFRVHLFPAFGSKPLSSITRQEVQEHLNQLIEQGKSRAAHKQRQILTSIFEYAEIDNLVARTPMKKIKLPVHEAENGTALTMEEENAFVEKCLSSKTRSGAAFIFLLCTGLRRSEMATATIEGEWITVVSAKQRMGRTIRVRRIPISPRLRRLLPNVETELESFKNLYPNRLARYLKEYLPNHHLHDLRHTFITRAQECGIPREVVSVWAGHKADNTMTSNVYTHFSDAFQLAEMQKFSY